MTDKAVYRWRCSFAAVSGANLKGFRLHPSGFDLRVENAMKD